MAHDAVNCLRRSLGSQSVFTDEKTVDFHSADALNPSRAYHTDPSAWSAPLGVVFPQSTDEVSEIVRVANRYETPIVPYGGGTGVMGAAVPPEGAIVIDMQRMNKVRTVSEEDRIAWAEAGVVLEDLDAVLANHRLMLGHDPYSKPIATVGGAVSTDGVGYLAARYGSMGAQVAALEVVLPTGDAMTTKAMAKPASGPDLNALFIGSEGTLGIITAAALHVFPLPEHRRFATVSFNTFEDGFHAVAEMFSIGLRPALTDLTEEPGDSVLLYLVFEGYKEEVDAQETRALRICKEHGGSDIGPDETIEYWKSRHNSGEVYKQEILQLSPRERWSRWWADRGHWDYLHLALPVSSVLEFRRRVEEISGRNNVAAREYSVWTDPGLFSFIMTGARLESDPGQDRFVETVDAVLRLAQQMGGAMEYCHGVGLKLSHLVQEEWGSRLDTARRIKRALDPHNLMNPGKLGL